jgi:hypothetical protein
LLTAAAMRTTLLVAVVTLCACGSDGANGEFGKVRFSMVFDAQEVSDFKPPIALGSSLLIKLEEPSTLAAGEAKEPGFPELTLEVQPVGHRGGAKVLPLGFAQYAIQLDSEGDYQLVAKEKDVVLDSLSVKSAKADHIRPSPKVNTLTSVRNGTQTCLVTRTLDVKDVVLRRNQTLTYSFTAADKDDKAMLGLLGLTASEDGDILELDTTWIFETGEPNGLVVKPKGTLTDKATVHITEASGMKLDLEIKTVNEDAALGCN